MSIYEALVKVNVTDARDRQLADIGEQLYELADRLVSEYDCPVEQAEDLFGRCIDIAIDAGVEREGEA